MQIKEVKNKTDLKKFLDLPSKVYKNDSKYVATPKLLVKDLLGLKKQDKKHILIAEKNGEVVARLAVKVHTAGDHTKLHFGFFESLPGEAEAVKALFDYAHKLYPELEMMGPFQFRLEDPFTGFLKDGHELDPYFLMSYNPKYYIDYMEQIGLELAMDLFTYQVHRSFQLPESILQNAKDAAAKGVTVRPIDYKKLNSEARTIANIFNDALSRNWGYEEFLEDQINEMVTLFKLFLDPRMIAIAEKEGKAIGALIMIPNYNPLIKPSKGSVTPGLIWKYFTQKKNLNSIRGYALGVLKEAHGLGIGSALTKAMFDWAQNSPYENCEISWILANNGPMNELSKAMGGQQNKTYRIYQKKPLQAH